jgi:hypothetical protein
MKILNLSIESQDFATDLLKQGIKTKNQTLQEPEFVMIRILGIFTFNN